MSEPVTHLHTSLDYRRLLLIQVAPVFANKLPIVENPLSNEAEEQRFQVAEQAILFVDTLLRCLN